MTGKLILVLNSGSSSLKFAIIDPEQDAPLLTGIAERLGSAEANFRMRWRHEEDKRQPCPNADHGRVIDQLFQHMHEHDIDAKDLTGVGHRVVHGGETFRDSAIIDEQVIAQIEQCAKLAPLHNPVNLLGIKAIAQKYPNLNQVAVFDTSFHQTLPEYAYTYALPYELYREHGLRRYGFHGSSHRFVAGRAADLLGKSLNDCNFISAHLGNGCSAAAIKGGVSVDTSMGLTPLEGLVMGSRCGDLDPGLVLHLTQTLNYTPDQLSHLLNKESGLLGVSEVSNDMRELLRLSDEGHQQATLAIDIFCYRLAKTIAGYYLATAPLDAIIFTGGIGENAAPVRAKVCAWLKPLGVDMDDEANHRHGEESQGRISKDDTLNIMVVPTNEELLIARDTLALIRRNK
ncbi:acetate/propionate family kinase [Hahella sp. HN01]|uniref:acetate/propionate family kinase n=1 Tax=Hahella sp. HN01 TaxID=2847262 RepID=UPI001C1EFCD0|nr:acetate kinase [Hahella sp. HN01]MBU6952572.1 acetate kinase [Hahella sp. HN01]